MTGYELAEKYKVTILGWGLDEECSETCVCGHHISLHYGIGSAGYCKLCAQIPYVAHNFRPALPYLLSSVLAKQRIAIRGMLDVDGKPVFEGDIVEFFDRCYACHINRAKQESEYSPLYGVVKWNEEYFTYEPLIFATDDFNGNCFANVCKPKAVHLDKSPSYFKVIGNILDNPELVKSLDFTQQVGK